MGRMVMADATRVVAMKGLRCFANRLSAVRVRRLGLAVSALAFGLAACAVPAAELVQPTAPAAPVDSGPLATFGYTGGVQSWPVPDGVASVQIAARGGQGGTVGDTSGDSVLGWGALVSGTVVVQPGQVLQISVGGNGGRPGQSSPAAGGWGGMGGDGGSGKAEKDHLRSSGGGGGATTVELSDTNGQNPQIILVAGGGGGMGGVSGGVNAGDGGNAGCGSAYSVNGTNYPFGKPDWSGSDGTDGTHPFEGKGGKAAAGPGITGATSIGGTGLGGDGGGGGGGVLGGAAGTGAKGTSAGGGGGAGSSTTNQMTNTTITCAASSNSPAVTLIQP